MVTECNPEQLEFHRLGRRSVVGGFDGGRISSDGGALLLREVEKRTGIVRSLAQCFVDHRDADAIEHSVEELVSQRVMGLALGYEDLNDHDGLRCDPLLAVVVGKADPLGANRVRAQDRGKALAGKSTLNRLELTPWNADAQSRYKKIVAKPGQLDALLVDVFLQSYAKHRSGFGWIWMRPMIRYTASKRVASFTAITGIIVTCRCTFSAVSTCCVPGSGSRILMRRPGRWKSLPALWGRFGDVGRRWRSGCGGIRGSVVKG